MADLGAVDEICGVRITNENEVLFLVNARDNRHETWVPCKEIAGALTPQLLKGYMHRAQKILGVDSRHQYLRAKLLGIHGVKISRDDEPSFMLHMSTFGRKSEKWVGPERYWPPELLNQYLDREKLVFNTMLAFMMENNDVSGAVGEASTTVAIAAATSPPNESSAQSDTCTLPNSADSLSTPNAATILSGEAAVNVFVGKITSIDEIRGVQMTDENEVLFLVKARDHQHETWVSCKQIAGALTPQLLHGYMDRSQRMSAVGSSRSALLNQYFDREELVFNTILAILEENKDDGGATVAIAAE